MKTIIVESEPLIYDYRLYRMNEVGFTDFNYFSLLVFGEIGTGHWKISFLASETIRFDAGCVGLSVAVAFRSKGCGSLNRKLSRTNQEHGEFFRIPLDKKCKMIERVEKNDGDEFS